MSTLFWGLTAKEALKYGVPAAALAVDALGKGYGALTDYWARQEEAKDKEYRRAMNAKQDEHDYNVNWWKDAIGLADTSVKFIKNVFGDYNNQVQETPKSYDQLKVVQAMRYPWAYRATLPANLPPYVPRDNHTFQDILKWQQSFKSEENKNNPYKGAETKVTTIKNPDGSVKRITEEVINKPKSKAKTTTTKPKATTKKATKKEEAASTVVREEAAKEDPSLNNVIPTINEQVESATTNMSPYPPASSEEMRNGLREMQEDFHRREREAYDREEAKKTTKKKSRIVVLTPENS